MTNRDITWLIVGAVAGFLLTSVFSIVKFFFPIIILIAVVFAVFYFTRREKAEGLLQTVLGWFRRGKMRQ